MNATDRVQKKAARFANRTNESGWETLVQRGQMAGKCGLYRKGMGMYRGQAQGPCYLSRDNHDHKFRTRKQRTDIGKYGVVSRTIKL